MFKLSDSLQQECYLNATQTQFKCNQCQQLAQQPVVTFCGHLFCWYCVHDKRACRVCLRKFQLNQFIPIYTSHHSHDQRQIKIQLPSKPKAIIRERIKNIALSNNNNLPYHIRLDSNIERGILLAGNGHFPSTAVNLLGDFGQGEDLQEQPSGESIKNSFGRFSVLLIVIVCVLIIMS